MKVLHVIPSIAPVRGGPSQAVLAMVKALRYRGVDAEIVTTNDNGNEFLDVPLRKRIIYQDVPVWFLPRFALPMKEFIFSGDLTKWLWQHIGDYDLVHNHYLFSYASSCAGLFARLHKIPYMVRTIGQLTPWALAQSHLKKQIYTSLIERHNLNHARAIHCTALGEAEDVRNFGIKTQTIVLPLGVDRADILPNAKSQLRHTYGIPDERQIVLFLSRLHYKKRPDLLIESFAKIIATNPDTQLVMAGSGEKEYVRHLQQIVAKHNLSDRVTFTGFVTGNDKQLLFQGSDIFALPSYSENFGIVVAEATIAGLPVVITPGVQISPEIAAANAGMVINDEIELVEAITQLLNDPQLRSQLSQNAIDFATQRYSWSNIADRLATHYAEIIKK